MLIYLLRRTGIYLLSLLLASALVFFVMSVLPGDPAVVMLGTQATPEALAELRAEYGLNQPVVARYFSWLGSALTGDLGRSVFTGLEIAPQVADRLTVTIPLALFAIGLTALIAFPAGIYAAARHCRLGDVAVSTMSRTCRSTTSVLGASRRRRRTSTWRRRRGWT